MEDVSPKNKFGSNTKSQNILGNKSQIAFLPLESALVTIIRKNKVLGHFSRQNVL